MNCIMDNYSFLTTNFILFSQPSDDTLIQIEAGSTHIMSGGDEQVRIKIRDTLLKCLRTL